MSIKSRREVIKSLFFASGLVLINQGGVNAFANTNYEGFKTWQTLQAEQFQSMVGQNFLIYGTKTGHSCEAVLESVLIGKADLDRPSSLVRKSSFSARFVAVGSECHKEDQIAHVSHPDIMGEDQLFVMAKNFSEGKWHLEIVFN